MLKLDQSGKTRDAIRAAANFAVEALELRQMLSTTVPGGVITTNTTWTAANGPYNLTGNVYIRSGATLTVQSGVTVTGSALHFSDDGSGGKLSATGATFSDQTFFGQAATATISSSTFTQYSEFDLYAGANGSTVSGTKFNGGIAAAPQFVASLAGNTFPANTVMGVLSTIISTPVSLPALSNVTSYNFVNGTQSTMYIRGGGSLTFASGATVTGDRLFVADDGSGGKVTAPSVNFNNQVIVGSTAVVSFTGDTFSQYTEFDFYSGASGTTVSSDKFNGGIASAPQFVASLAGNTFPASTVMGVLSTIITTPVSLPALSNVTSYNFVNGTQSTMYIRGGGSLTFASGATVTGDRLFVADDGSGGKVTAPSVNFNNQVIVGSTAVVSFTGDTFSQYTEFDFYSGASGTTVSSNKFNGGIASAPQFVASLAGNTFPANTVMGVLSTIISTPVSLPALSNVTSYNFVNANQSTMYIRGGGSLTFATGATVTGDRLFVADDGSGGKVTAPSVNFNNQVIVGSTAVVSFTGDTFSQYTEFDFYSGASGSTVSSDKFNGGIASAPQFVASLAGNTFPANTVMGVLSTIISTPVSLPALSNVTSYNFVNANQSTMYIRGGGSLTFATGATVTGDRLFVADDGTGGKVTAPSVNFNNQVIVGSTAVVSFTGDTFSQYTEFDFYSGASGTTVSSDKFNGGIASAPQFVASLAGNTFPANTVMGVLSTIISTPVSLPALSNVTSYNFVNANQSTMYVRGSGSLTIANGNTITGDALLISDTGTAGALNAQAVTFTDNVTFGPSSTGTVTYDKFTNSGGIFVDGHELATITKDDLSASAATAQGTGGPINLNGNYWGTTDAATIGASKIHDNADNSNLPVITYASPLAADPTLPDLTPTVPTVTAGPWVAGQSINVTYTIKNIAGVAAAPASGLSFVLKNVSTGATRTLGLIDLSSIAAGKSATGTAALQLPAATDSYWGASGLPGSYKIVINADATNIIVEQYESNNAQSSAAVTISKAGTITGTLFNDANGDGSDDNGETGLSYWVVFIDTNGDGTPDNGERVAVTGSNGQYSFTGLAAGTYRVTEVLQQGYRVTTGSVFSNVTVTSGATTTAPAFGDTTMP